MISVYGQIWLDIAGIWPVGTATLGKYYRNMFI